jgi:NAD(P)H-dependent flavin oxidoreductase YrpB (nitropropane dioxygenase family)
VLDSNRRVAEALDVPTLALELWLYIGFVPLAVGGMAGIAWLGWVSAVVGAGLLVIGLRAVMRPARPYDSGVPAMRRVMGGSKQVGAFYALAGVLWIALSVAVIRG